MPKCAHVALLEVVPLKGCKLLPPPFVGGAIRVYVAAKNETEAIEQITKQFEVDLLQIVELLWCVNGRTAVWEDENSIDAKRYMKMADSSDEVVYGRIDAWTQDDA